MNNNHMKRSQNIQNLKCKFKQTEGAVFTLRMAKMIDDKFLCVNMCFIYSNTYMYIHTCIFMCTAGICLIILSEKVGRI